MRRTFFLILACIAVLTARAEIQVDWTPLGSNTPGWNIATGGFEFGFIDATGLKGQSMGRSIQLSWLYTVGAKYVTPSGAQRFIMGVGLDWRNYKMGSERCFTKVDPGLDVINYPDGVTSRSSRLKVFSLTVPLVFRQRIYDRWGVFVGEVTCFNAHAGMKTHYTTPEGEKIIDHTSRDLHVAPVTADLIAGVNWSGVGLYVRYSPFRVIKKGYGPDFKTLSTGVMFLF